MVKFSVLKLLPVFVILTPYIYVEYVNLYNKDTAFSNMIYTFHCSKIGPSYGWFELSKEGKRNLWLQ
jgi:hypothetical protein